MKSFMRRLGVASDVESAQHQRARTAMIFMVASLGCMNGRVRDIGYQWEAIGCDGLRRSPHLSVIVCRVQVLAAPSASIVR
jgi:hypothetical protein